MLRWLLIAVGVLLSLFGLAIGWVTFPDNEKYWNVPEAPWKRIPRADPEFHKLSSQLRPFNLETFYVCTQRTCGFAGRFVIVKHADPSGVSSRDAGDDRSEDVFALLNRSGAPPTETWEAVSAKASYHYGSKRNEFNYHVAQVDRNASVEPQEILIKAEKKLPQRGKATSAR